MHRRSRIVASADGSATRALLWLVVGLAALVALIALTAPELVWRDPSAVSEVLLLAGIAGIPGLLVLLWIGPVVDRYRTAAMLAGAGLTVLISFLPSAPGNAVERLVPFAVAAAIAVAGAMGARRQR